MEEFLIKALKGLFEQSPTVAFVLALVWLAIKSGTIKAFFEGLASSFPKEVKATFADEEMKKLANTVADATAKAVTNKLKEVGCSCIERPSPDA